MMVLSERQRAASRKWKSAHLEHVLDYSRQYRAENPERYREALRRCLENKREFVREVVGAVCVDCTEDRPEAIEYHHPAGDTRPKKWGMRNRPSLAHLSWKALKEEVMHLIALCGTCHNLRHREILDGVS